MNIKKQLRNLKHEADTKLEKAVITDLLSYSNDNEDLESYISDIVNYGLSGGNVSSMIYYTDTLAFYKKHKEDINIMLSELLQDCGFTSISELLKDFDNDDIMVLDTSNQNLLAWYSYESIVNNLWNELNSN